jgi:hypothetical protein
VGLCFCVVAFVLAWTQVYAFVAPLLALLVVVGVRKVSGLGAGAVLIAAAPILFASCGCDRSSPYVYSRLACGTGQAGLLMLSPFVFGAIALVLLLAFVVPGPTGIRYSLVKALAAVFGGVALYSVVAHRPYQNSYDDYLATLERQPIVYGSTARVGDVEVRYERDPNPPAYPDSSGEPREYAKLSVLRPNGAGPGVIITEDSYPGKPALVQWRDPKTGVLIFGPEGGGGPQLAVRNGQRAEVTRAEVHGPHRVPRAHWLDGLACMLVGVLCIGFLWFKTRTRRAIVAARCVEGDRFETLAAPTTEVAVDMGGHAQLAPGALAYVTPVPRPTNEPYRESSVQRFAYVHGEAEHERVRDHRDGALLLVAAAFAWSGAILFGA